MNILKKMEITRRSFVKTIVGATAGCACFQLHSFAIADSGNLNEQGKNDEVSGNNENLVAVCGLYCGACSVYIDTQNNDEEKQKALLKKLKQLLPEPEKLKIEDLLCDGCMGASRVASLCRDCAIRLCPNDKQDVTRCSDCKDFPCSRINNLNQNDSLHLREVIKNLEQIRKMGIEKWAKYEAERWQCPRCHSPISYYDDKCSNCGTPRSERLFPIPQVGKQP